MDTILNASVCSEPDLGLRQSVRLHHSRLALRIMFNKGQKKVTTTKWEQNLLWKLAIDKSPGRHANESGKNMKLALRQDSSDQGRNPCITYKTSSSVKTSVLSQRQLCNLFPLLSIGLLIKHYKPLFWYANRPFWQSNQFTIDNMSHMFFFFFIEHPVSLWNMPHYRSKNQSQTFHVDL